MKTVRIVLAKDEIGSAYLKNLAGGGLFIPTTDLFGLDESLELVVTVPGVGDFHLRGKVAWHRRRRAWSSSLPSGFGFQAAAEEGPKMRFLLKLANGDEYNRRRPGGERRYVEYAVRLKILDIWVPARTINVSEGGMLLSCEEPIREGASLQCIIYTDDSVRPLECNVIVERVDKEGRLYTVAVRFMRSTPAIRRTFSAAPLRKPVSSPPPRLQGRGARRSSRDLNASPHRPTLVPGMNKAAGGLLAETRGVRVGRIGVKKTVPLIKKP